MNSYRKAKTVAKDMIVHGPVLEKKVLETMKIIADMVGSTLGPSGRPVLIERQEYGLPHIFTKDGVTVFRNLGFQDPTAHAIMESARDSAGRTASEAGDGPQPLWSKVLTPNGYVEMKSIHVGDKICGTNNTVQEVVGVYSKGQKEIYEVHFTGNRVVECCADHLWAVNAKFADYDESLTLTTKQVLKELGNADFYTPDPNGEGPGNKIVKIERTGKFTEMQCIKVSNPDNLYITDNFIVTHNTTTATVLAEAIVRKTSEYCKKHPTVSPQKVVRHLEDVFNKEIQPFIKNQSMEADREMLHSVAKLSANGDEELATAVMKCFDAIGDDGNIIINEQSGPSAYEVEFTKGYPIAMGYEDSCGKLFPLFLNDKNNNRTFLEKPVFLLYFGAITQIQTIEKLMQEIGSAWENPQHHGLDKPFNYNVVIVATGFSESVLGDLSANFSHPHTINVFPLLTPRSPIQSGEMHFLYDLAAVTGATVFDPIGKPIENATLQDLGYGIQSFEATRYRSTILGLADEALIEMRADELRDSIRTSESKYDTNFIIERLAKLTSGIAKLKVIGPSSGELREKRDRAEDATFAVRGAKKHGCLPGGGWTLLKLTQHLSKNEINEEILFPALLEPIHKLLNNCGLHSDEITEIVGYLESNDSTVYDAMEQQFVEPKTSGILDSTPAVLEAIRNSISIASMLGTLGGSIVFKRDDEMERAEASSAIEAEKIAFGE